MTKEYLEFTQEEIENALAKMPADQREVVTDIADRDMLEYIPNIGEKAIPDYISECMVDAIVDALTPHIRDAIYGCTMGLNHYVDPFKTYRKLILDERERDGVADEETR